MSDSLGYNNQFQRNLSNDLYDSEKDFNICDLGNFLCKCTGG